MHIPHSRPIFGEDYNQAIKHVVQSGILAQGSANLALKTQIQQQLHLKYTLAVDSGTSALMLAIRSLTDNKAQARIGIPSYACASLWFAVKNANATPVLLDCNDQLTLETEAVFNISNTLDALVLVHPFGMVEPLAAESLACPVIEDIAQSAGATLHGKPVGSFGDICIGSHYATKPWGGAYGGFIASNNPTPIETCHSMIDPDHANLDNAYVGHHQLSDVHATLAGTRIKHAAEETKQRTIWAAQYDTVIANTSATPITSCKHSVSNHFRYIIRCTEPADNVISQFRALGICASKPVQTPLHHGTSFDCPHTEKAWKYHVSLPLLPDMSNQEFTYLCEGIQQCLAS